MILEEETYDAFGYYPSNLKPDSRKHILAACETCGEFRVPLRQSYRTFCKSCIKKGNTNCLGYKATDEAKANISAALKGNTHALGCKYTEEIKANMSAARKGKYLGENASNWRGGISFLPYCIKFNNRYKNHIRNLFGNECFLCGLLEADNGRKLDVHHVNYNKDCGCDGAKCICVPLCMRCHMKTNYNRDYWQALIMEMLKPMEAWI